MTKQSQERAWNLAWKICVPLVLALSGLLVAHEVRLSVIESTRYTPADAVVMERETNEKFGELHGQLAEIKTDLAVVRQILEQREEDE